MGRKSQKRNKKESDGNSTTSSSSNRNVKVASKNCNSNSNTSFGDRDTDTVTTSSSKPTGTPEYHPQIHPVKVLNPFYIESTSMSYSNNECESSQYQHYDDQNVYEDDDGSNGDEEQFGLLEYEDFRNDVHCNTTANGTQKQAQLQRGKQLALEWNIRMCLIVMILLLLTWLLLSIVNSSSTTTTFENPDCF
jgi:hypothetical protein